MKQNLIRGIKPQKFGLTLGTFFIVAVMALLLTGCDDDDSVNTSEIDYYSAIGKGTESSPYLIYNYLQLRNLASCVNYSQIKEREYYYRLEDNIEIPDTVKWMPIGSSSIIVNGDTAIFHGHFDGNNKTISLSNIYRYNYMGLFGIIDGGSIKNLNVNIQITDTVIDAYIGGIAGYARNGASISDCNVTDSINVLYVGDIHMGHICGAIDSSSTITNCEGNGTLISKELN